ncbi:hypothetical protein ABS768_07090 [Flavobacterium sp. ST-75]|uniref:Lipoprotein n=1 Tax=Flavobacterium rhizophilum TaxID=3163296 RepID=A0ABW8YAL9_9FLAO
MKSIAICVFTLFALVFLGCKQQKEEEQSKSEEVLEKATSVEQEQNIVPVERYFTDAPVAVVKNGEIEYTDYDAFLEKWKSVTGKEGVIATIEIKKTDVGGVDDNFYMVLASSEDKKTKFGTLLTMQNSKLYYYAPQDIVVMIMCKGCVDDCEVIVAYNGVASLSCSEGCSDCIKREGIFRLKRSE